MYNLESVRRFSQGRFQKQIGKTVVTVGKVITYVSAATLVVGGVAAGVEAVAGHTEVAIEVIENDAYSALSVFGGLAVVGAGTAIEERGEDNECVSGLTTEQYDMLRSGQQGETNV
jgi:hypothetical protein